MRFCSARSTRLKVLRSVPSAAQSCPRHHTVDHDPDVGQIQFRRIGMVLEHRLAQLLQCELRIGGPVIERLVGVLLHRRQVHQMATVGGEIGRGCLGIQSGSACSTCLKREGDCLSVGSLSSVSGATDVKARSRLSRYRWPAHRWHRLAGRSGCTPGGRSNRPRVRSSATARHCRRVFCVLSSDAPSLQRVEALKATGDGVSENQRTSCSVPIRTAMSRC
jgi:hypothetical protein